MGSKEEENLENTREKRSRVEVDAIVARIEDMMVSGAWSRGASEKALAAEYDVSISMVRQWTIQASRAVMRVADPLAIEETRAATVSSLERLARKAEAWASAPAGDKRLIREAITAVVKAAEVAGVMVTAGPQVNVQVDVQVRTALAAIGAATGAHLAEDILPAIRAGLAEDLGLDGDLLERATAAIAVRVTGARPLLEARFVEAMADEPRKT